MLLAIGVHVLLCLAKVVVLEIALVGEEDHGDGLVVLAPRHLGVDVSLPLGNGVEGVDAGEIEHHKGANSLLVVDTGHVAETLLAGNVPKLKPHFGLRVPLDELKSKINTNLINQKINKCENSNNYHIKLINNTHPYVYKSIFIFIACNLMFYGRFVVRGEDVVDITLDDACLASTNVTDNKDLEKILSLNFTAFVSS